MDMYTRTDICYCSGCGRFFDEATEAEVDIPYTEMPADFAIQVMNDRKRSPGWCHPRWRRRNGKKKGTGFGN